MLIKYNKYDQFQSDCWTIYKALYRTRYGVDPVIDYKYRRNIFKKLWRKYHHNQVYAIIFSHFEWRTLSGENNKIYNFYFKKGFPLRFFEFQSENYAQYCKQILGDVWEDQSKLGLVIDKCKEMLAKDTF